MNDLLALIHEQFLEYSKQLETVEKDIIRKFKSGEDYSEDVSKAVGLKALKEQAVLMMARRTQPSQS